MCSASLGMTRNSPLVELPSINFSLPVIGLAIGAAILFFGRKLFWLFVAALGFAVGVEITTHVLRDPPVWLGLVIALGLGLIGALIAMFLQKVAIAIAGFLAGGGIAVAAFNAFSTTPVPMFSLTFLIGGLAGAVLLLLLFDWALILLSSIEGAHLIAGRIHIAATGAMVLTVALAIVGLVVQGSMLRRSRSTAD